MDTFGKRLKVASVARDLSVTQLAAIVGVSESTVYGWISGRSLPDIDKGLLLATELGLDPWWLTFGVARPKRLPSPETTAVLPSLEPTGQLAEGDEQWLNLVRAASSKERK